MDIAKRKEPIKIFFISAITLLFILIALLLAVAKGIKIDEQKNTFVEKIPFGEVSVGAKSVIVWDILNKKALYEKNPDLPLPLASIAKIMTAITAYELIPNYTTITISGDFLMEDEDFGLRQNEKWRLKDLINFSLVTSSNVGTRAIASVAGSVNAGTNSYENGLSNFIRQMNIKAKDIGLGNTIFYNESGLDLSDSEVGAIGTARDAVKMFEYAIRNHPEMIEATNKNPFNVKSLDDVSHTAKNTNSLAYEIPGLIASKTGFTELAGGNLVVAFSPSLSHPIIIAVLGGTYDGRFSDIRALIRKTMDYIEKE